MDGSQMQQRQLIANPEGNKRSLSKQDSVKKIKINVGNSRNMFQAGPKTSAGFHKAETKELMDASRKVHNTSNLDYMDDKHKVM